MELIKVKLDELVMKNNPRVDFSSVDELAQSISEVGLLHPIVVRQSGHDARLIVVDGVCRLRALKKLGETSTQVVIVDLGEEKTGEATLVANLVRSDLNILELGAGWARLMESFPAKYNKASISKKFGRPAATVKGLVRISQKISHNLFPVLSPILQHLDSNDLEIIAAIQNPEAQERLVSRLVKTGGTNVWAAVNTLFKRLDFTDAFGYEKAKQNPAKCFVMKANGLETVWTVDEKFYLQCKTEFEKANPKRDLEYGKAEEMREEEHAEKTEREKKAEARKREARQKARKTAKTVIQSRLQGFIRRSVSAAHVGLLGKKLCMNGLDADACRRLWTIFGIEGADKVNAYDLREKTWEKIFQKMVQGPEGLVQLHRFLEINRMPSSERSVEELWAAGISK